MDREVEKYYNNLFDLFRTEGWKQIMQEVEDNITATNSVVDVKDNEDLFFKKGQLQVLTTFRRLEETVDLAWQEMENRGRYEEDV